MNDVNKILEARGALYGPFSEHARVSQDIKRALRSSENWGTLSDDKKEALEMVAHKLARIVCGDPEYKDSWVDIVGYTQLVCNTLGDPK